MSGQFDHLRKRRPQEIAQEILDTKLDIKTNLVREDGHTLTADHTLIDLVGYMKHEERLDVLGELMELAERFRNEGELARLHNIKQWMRYIDVDPASSKLPAELEQKREQAASDCRDLVDSACLIPDLEEIIRKTAAAEPLPDYSPFNPKDILSETLAKLKGYREDLDSVAVDVRKLTGSSEFRDALSGAADYYAAGEQLPEDMYSAAAHGQQLSGDKNLGEDLSVEMVEFQMKLRAEMKQLDRLVVKLEEFGQAMGMGRRMGG